MTSRPLPPTPYRGPIISAARPLPAAPPPSTSQTSPSSLIALKRRPHTRRLQPASSSELSSVSEEDEGALAEDDEPPVTTKPRRRPRPSPLIPPRSYGSSKMPLILEVPDTPMTLQEQSTKSSELEKISLSPSTLFERRPSKTIFDFPVPPSTRAAPSTLIPSSRSLSTPTTPPRHSPTLSNISFSSTSTDSSPCPLTPIPSDNDDYEALRGHSAEQTDFVTIEDFAQELDARCPRAFRRSASVVSLRSFSTVDFDARVKPIYALMNPRQTPLVPVVQVPRVAPQNAQTRKEEDLQDPTQNEARSPHLMLSVLDTTHGGSFDVPLVLGSFLSPPSSPCSLNSDDSESDWEGISISWSDSEADDGPLSPAYSSSEDGMSDDEAPHRVLDPAYHTGIYRRQTSTHGNSPQPLQHLEPLQLDHATPNIPPVHPFASSGERRYDRPLPRESLVPSDVSSRLSAVPLSYHRPSVPRHFSPPELRSRFSTSTLASIPEPPTSSSSKHAFFARLTGRTKPSREGPKPFSPTKERPSLASYPPRGSVRRRAPIPPPPAPSAFSFSTQSASSHLSLYSTDSGSCSCLSDESSGSTGLRRPPIPIELFLRG